MISEQRINEDDWLTTLDFGTNEAKTESDGKYKKNDGRHYILNMDKQCQFCGAVGFELEV